MRFKKFISTALAAAIAVGGASFADVSADAAAKVPAAKYKFSMDGASKNVVAVARSAKTETDNFTNTDSMPTAANAKKIKLKYAKGHKGKALHLDRKSSYGAQLKGVNVGKGSWTVSFWVKAESSVSQYMPIFFTTSSVAEKDARWVSITRMDALGAATPCVWSRAATEGDAAFPWYSNNEWVADDAIGTNKWVHVVLTVNTKKTIEYEALKYKGYHGKTYINGKYYGNGAVAKEAVSGKNKFFLGINGWDTPFKGYFDDVQFWTKALSAKQVKALYNSQK